MKRPCKAIFDVHFIDANSILIILPLAFTNTLAIYHFTVQISTQNHPLKQPIQPNLRHQLPKQQQHQPQQQQ